MFDALCLLASIGILIFILRYRVHIHVTYTAPNSRRLIASTARKSGAPRPSDPRAPRPITSVQTIQDISSALVNLGMQRTSARKIAEKVCRSWPDATFDQLLKIALQEAA